MEKNVFVLAETAKGSVIQETYELLTFAKALPGSADPKIIIIGNNSAAQAAYLSEKTGCDIIAITGSHFEFYNSLAYCSALLEVLPQDDPFYLCLSHTSTGYDLAPLLSVKLNAACITSVEKTQDGVFSRAVCSGRFLADIIPHTPSAVITVLPGAYPPFVPENHPEGSVTTLEIPTPQLRSTTVCIKESIHRDSALKDADVIVSAGRGVGNKDNISLIRELAEVFPRSAIGASRSVCDLGWMEYSCQIGTTGKTVSPRLYIACGISGAVQHLSGMKGSQNIVAINTDPNAAIFHAAHYCIVEDLTTFIPILLEELSMRPCR